MKKSKIEKNNTAQIKSLVEKSASKTSELRYGEDGNELIVVVYPVLPFTKRMQMIREIVDGVFMDEKDTVLTYAPEFLSLLKKYAIIKYFTDLSLPNKLDDMWLVLNYTTIYDDVAQIIGDKEINDIFEAAENGIDTYRQYLITKTDTNSFMNKISKAISDFEANIPQEDMAQALESLKDMPQGFNMQDFMNVLLKGNIKSE